jgi:succinate-acetate transporter protein
MTIAAICEFILGNTFPFVVFMVYGVHWVNIAYSGDPAHPLSAAYGADPNTSLAYNAGNGLYNLVMAMVSFIFLLGSLRTNVPFVIVFFTLVFLFGFFAAADFKIGHDPTEAGIAYATCLLKIGGGFGFITLSVSW